MDQKLIELAQRRGELLAEIRQQRASLAASVTPLASVLHKLDKVGEGVQWLKRHPAAVALGAFALVVSKPRRAWRWAKRSVVLWRGWSALRNRFQLL